MAIYSVNNGDNLWTIVKKQYGYTSATEIHNKINEIAKKNNIKNTNLIFANQKLELPEELKLKSVSIITPNGEATTMEDNTGNTNYYRATSIFGDIATKKAEYPADFTKSELKLTTQGTKEVETVIAEVDADLTITSRDGQAYDIAAKAAGVGGFKDMKGTDAYKFFLEINKDDFTTRETMYKGQIEEKEFFDASKSDGKITLFSSEIINGKEYLAMRDKEGKVHYFDLENKLTEDKTL